MDQYFLIVIRTIILYGVISIIFRLMGKRELGELNVLDLVVYIMIAEIAVVGIEKPEETIVNNILPMAVLMIIQITLAFFSLKSKKVRDMLDGKPSIIINNGKIDEHEMRKQRYNFDDLLLQLRDKDIRNIGDVEFAILETSGKLSVYEKSPNQGGITIPLILDGEVQERNLQRLEKNKFWLLQELKKLGYTQVKEISFCSFQDGKFFVDRIDTKKR
ncbi:YetF domain-containing protein [Robertmurraya sp. FSL R5-0851]|uniref:YetF domain-containing protein n=1 Tax=Robertmurraya sp. FSL R5-0851 TaxID=2921584 RepID=UPI00136E6563